MANKNMMVIVFASSSFFVVLVLGVLAFVFRDKLGNLFGKKGSDGPASEVYGSNAQEPAADGLCPDSEPGGSPACDPGFRLNATRDKCCVWDDPNNCSGTLHKQKYPTFFWGKNFDKHANSPKSYPQGEYADEDDYNKNNADHKNNKPLSLRVPKGFIVEAWTKEGFGGCCRQYGAGEHTLKRETDSWKVFCGSTPVDCGPGRTGDCAKDMW